MAYSLVTSYAGNALVDGFNWIDTRDYSNGFVRYQSQSNAASQGLFAVDAQTGVVRIGVDHTNTYDVTGGRPSIRIESKYAYNHGLFIGDFLHMPPSQCGVWPAFWAYGPDWPKGGEIDIIEGANTAHRNIISAHTTPGCELGPDVLAMASGVSQDTNCDVGTQNIGCGYVAPASDTSSYGDTFNAVGGGIYAMEWDDKYIKVWHFDRASAPADIAAKQPDPTGWGKPQAVYGGKSCDVKSHFRDMSIVLNINFCGDYGNAMWAANGCTAYAPTCNEWVAKNPTAFASAYWDVNYIDAYVQGAGNNATSSSTTSSGPTAGHSQPSNIPIPTASFTTVPGPRPGKNGTQTRYPVANNSTMLKPTNPSTTTPAAATTEVAAPERVGPVPTTSLPLPSNKVHANPANLNDFSYLGCFGSSSDFKSFTKVADSADMDLDKCTELCQGKKYAGVFDTTCYCAEKLDADTRVSTEACDTVCPGDDSQFCGGRVKGRVGILDGGIGGKANTTESEISGSVSGSSMPLQTEDGNLGNPAGGFKFGNSTGTEKPLPSGTGSPMAKGNSTTVVPAAKFSSTPTPSSSETSDDDGPVVTIPVYPIPKEKENNATEPSSTGSSAAAASGSAPAMLSNSTLAGRHLLAARSVMLKSVRPGAIDRREASDFLLTMYASIAKEEAPKQPPAMGIQTPQAKFSSAAATQTVNPTTRTTSTVVTTVAYETVHPSNPSQIVTEMYVTTIVKAHCGCTETPPPVMTVPMSTKVVSCSACGLKGENTVTITVPCSVDIATSTSAPSGSVPPAISHKVPQASVHNVPPVHSEYVHPAPSEKVNPAPSQKVNPAPSQKVNPAPSEKVNPVPSEKVNPAPTQKGHPAPSGKLPPPHGNNEVPASGASAPPASTGHVRPAPPSSPPVIAGASGLKVTSLFLTTMLTMVLLL